MKNTAKKFLSLLLAAMMIFGAAAASAGSIDFADIGIKAEAADVITGSHGSDITWTLDESTGALTISGKGPMLDEVLSSVYSDWREYTDKIKTVVIENGITSVGYCAFLECTSLTKVTLPESITSIDYGAFGGCTSLVSITLPSKVKEIGERAFFNCTSLKKVVINDGLKSIAEDAFYKCRELISINLPDSITYIGNGVFAESGYMTIDNFVNGVFYIGNHLISTYGVAANYKIKSGTITISPNAFREQDIEKVTIPDSVVYIGENAFMDCEYLYDITIPDSVTRIGKNAITNTGYYNSYSNWDGNVLYCGNHLIYADPALSGSYTVKNGTLTIAECAFEDCDSVAKINTGDTVTNIGANAFYTTGIQSIVLGKSVKEIGAEPLLCDDLTSISVSSANPNFSSDDSGVLFDKKKTELIQYPVGHKRTEYTVPDGVKVIGDNSFTYALNLLTVNIPDSVETIGEMAFLLCENLFELDLGNGVKTLGYGAFAMCISLTEVTIPGSVTDTGIVTFLGSPVETVVVEEGVTSINDATFLMSESLTNVTLPNSLRRIEALAFAYSAIEEITVPEGVEYIGYGAFALCENLTTINLPGTLKEFGEDVFVGSYNFCEINYNGTEAQWNKILVGNGNTELFEAEVYYPPHVHSYTSKVTKKATCKAEGVKTYTCTCGDSYTEVIPVSGHTAKTVTVAATCTKDGKKYDECSVCKTKLTGETVIKATGHKAGAWEVVTQATTEKEGKKVQKCTVCKAVVNEQSIPKLELPASIEIKAPSTTSITYGDSIILHAEVTNLPKGGKIVWSADNANFTYTVSEDGTTCTISPAASGTTTFTVTVVDASGEEISSDTQTMTSNAGFFQKIIAFFKKLFGLTKVYSEIFKIK